MITLNEVTKVYIAIGGKGQFSTGKNDDADYYYVDSKMLKGGYNGGGKGVDYPTGASSGGGATDFRLLENDLWHRILVAGGGGGSDNLAGDFRGRDDGSGGAGGGKTAQGFWVNGVYNNKYIANQTMGFSFGYGESATEYGSKNNNGFPDVGGADDRAGSGSGWFGGFASHNGNAGAGGGSSFAFTADAEIIDGDISAYDSSYNFIKKQPYAFDKIIHSKYIVSNAKFLQGIWDGNGKAIITYFPLNNNKMRCFTGQSLFVDFNLLVYLFQIYVI